MQPPASSTDLTQLSDRELWKLTERAVLFVDPDYLYDTRVVRLAWYGTLMRCLSELKSRGVQLSLGRYVATSR